MTKKPKSRFRLLVYERMWQRWAWPCILLVVASAVLWWFAPRSRLLYAPLRPLTLVPGMAALLILIYAYLARQLASVRCKPAHLYIQTPLYPLAVSYSRVKAVRPTTFTQVFNPAEEKAARRSWLEPYWGQTVVVVELSRYPFSKTWMRLWFSPYLLNPEEPSFVFLVDDWMALSRQLDGARSAWDMRRAEQRQGI